MSLTGHQGNQLIALKFLPTGYHIATGGDDNTIKFWDLRMRGKNITTIPAHTKLISDIKFDESSRLMFTTSYDCKCKIWGAKSFLYGENTADEWVNLRTLHGHENKLTSVSFTSDLKTIVTTSFDRTFKVWKN